MNKEDIDTLAIKRPKLDEDVQLNEKIKNENESENETESTKFTSPCEICREMREKLDEEYFRCYAGIHIHEEMLGDKVRTNTYRWAILKNYELIRGKVVMDVGAGTGILSIFCVQAGAKKVYAVEGSDMADQLQLIVNENKMADKITILHNKIEDVVLPEKVDVIISEWMGYMLLYESMLSSVLLARDRWLKPGGIMLPSSATLFIAPFTDDTYNERMDFWRNLKDTYKVSMDSMMQFAQISIACSVSVRSISMECVQSRAAEICHLDLATCTLKSLNHIMGSFSYSCYGYAQIHGFVTWFTVDFPQDISLSTSPYQLETHWQQTVLHIDSPVQVTQDTPIHGSLSIRPNSFKPRFLDLELQYQIDDNSAITQNYLMDDQIT